MEMLVLMTTSGAMSAVPTNKVISVTTKKECVSGCEFSVIKLDNGDEINATSSFMEIVSDIESPARQFFTNDHPERNDDEVFLGIVISAFRRRLREFKTLRSGRKCVGCNMWPVFVKKSEWEYRELIETVEAQGISRKWSKHEKDVHNHKKTGRNDPVRGA